jgi:apolipoprotein N-acyltransferase
VMKTIYTWIKDLLFQLCLVAEASVLFTLSFPNPIFENGIPFLRWFAYIPILLLIQRNSILQCIGWGAIYGCLTYFLFNYWLMTFHSMAGVVVYSIYLVYLAAVFLLFKIAEYFYPKKAYLVQWIIWLGYEYLRTTGYLGYPYGITGYSQWKIIPLIQIASITGVWGVSALVAFPSFWLAAALKNQSGISPNSFVSSIAAFFKKEKVSAICWALSLTFSLVYGIISIKDYSNKNISDLPSMQIALIQHNTDPWEATNAPSSWHTLEAYKKDLEILKRLSQEALASKPEPDIIVWPETAFVPRIYWHSTYRNEQETWLIVKDLLDYLSTKEVPFLIGNDDARKDPAKNPSEYEDYRVDYNAALLFENGKITEIYRKIHLVPVTEHFPYQKLFPSFYNFLQRKETHFWAKGEEETVFNIKGFNFSTPICFEDTFGNLPRKFVLRGADIFVNITNDAWAKSLSSQKQHLSKAVFRAVENYRSMVRSTVSGQTCVIDPLGRITTEAVPFTETWLNVSVPVFENTTIYTLYGDYLGIGFLFAAVIFLLSPAVWYTIKKKKETENE